MQLPPDLFHTGAVLSQISVDDTGSGANLDNTGRDIKDQQAVI